MSEESKFRQNLLNLLITWAEINSGSDNLPGLSRMLTALETSFSRLDGAMERISLSARPVLSPSGKLSTLPIGQALRIKKRTNAPVQILLAGHMDTVYSETHPFQKTTIKERNVLEGPGVADMKGGLVIMLAALEAFEKHPLSSYLGWEVLITPDEETGSHGSEFLFREAAKRNDFGLVFEPSFHDGALVSSRKGSLNFSVAAIGKAAHAGRDFEKGRNAIAAIAAFLAHANQLNDKEKEVTVNPGFICGGGPVNIVPDQAFCRVNARAVLPADFENLKKSLREIAKTNEKEGITFIFHLEASRPPKLFDVKSSLLFDQLNICAAEEGYTLSYRPSGGVCDGNILAEEGLPVLDTLGAVGGNIHTADEYILIDSLEQRSKLIERFLIYLATEAKEKNEKK